MPIWTGPTAFFWMNGPPLSPAHAWTSGASVGEILAQISEAMIAFG